MKSHYDVLGLDPSSDPEVIKKAFRREIARYHPDKVSHLGPEFQAMAATKAAELTTAYTTLSNATTRAAYDAALTGARPAPAPPPQPDPVTPPEPAAPPASFDDRGQAGVEFRRRSVRHHAPRRDWPAACGADDGRARRRIRLGPRVRAVDGFAGQNLALPSHRTAERARSGSPPSSTRTWWSTPTRRR